ncbi:MerR family transcriptional regulator [Natronosporangium hydrolyticum]|uniref:MerR family transcriptional regulator n=1 Tax=Natronosporangium hydrolyticum TaxID=2811111 RepID=A0A895Y5J6_9ACTN|nr:MerR family transcriptional regulator [Natronosporangium hydrolyticum]
MAAVDDEQLSIGRFAALTRLSLKALRLYDENGLLPAAHVDPHSGYRYYSPRQCERAVLIGALRRIGTPLATIRDVLDAEPDDGLAIFHEWWVSEQREFQNRRGLARYVTARLSPRGEPTMEIRTRVVPERKLAFIGKEMFQPELEKFIMRSFTTIFDHLIALGLRTNGTTPEEPTYTIFHGPVTPDQSSLVEVCVPFVGSVEPAADIAIRLEPEHHEAFTPLTNREAQFPQILHAYDAVAQWVHANGEPIATMPCREVYVTNVPDADLDDHVMDVAFPYLPEGSSAGKKV